jgi:hypothetical protein
MVQQQQERKRIMNNNSNLTPVLVTTLHRGVFFGYTDDYSGDTITLQKGRMAIYWSMDVKGCFGLAATGPSKHCRVGPPSTIEVRNVTAVALVSDEAVNAWEQAPWAN